MRSEREIRARIEELKEKMKAIKADARTEIFGEPKYENHLLYCGLMIDVMNHYSDVAVLLWVLDEPLTQEIDILTRLDPADEERVRLMRKVKA